MDHSGMGHYQQLTWEQRYGIYPHGSLRDTLLKTGHNQSEIAAGIGVHKSTISRELRRNKDLWDYRHKQAHDLATARRKEKARPRIDAGRIRFA